MRIHNIYVDDAGETHWRDIEVQWVEERNGSKLSARLGLKLCARRFAGLCSIETLAAIA